MSATREYLRGLARIHETGAAVPETSYYGQLETLLNQIGANLSPQIMCVLNPRNQGAGIPDGGLFVSSAAVKQAGQEAILARAPERGVVEVKGTSEDVRQIARTQQVRKYLTRYGKVLVTTYREFLVLKLDDRGAPAVGETFSFASSESDFWALVHAGDAVSSERAADFEGFLKRSLLGDAPLSQPEDLAEFLAVYAREGRRRLESADGKATKALARLREAMEDGLGLEFEGPEGEHFFRSALIQTLFYGVFAAWVVWSEGEPPDGSNRFKWQSAQWTLRVPMVRVLFSQVATPSTLPAGIDEVLDWTEDVLARVDRKLFFKRFETGSAVQYFYEPFLQAYDPALRKQLGVWYTPPEIVRYMVLRVHQALQNDLGIELGLADEQVHVLDPCTGTGSFLVETIETIARALDEHHGDSLVAQEAKTAALTRIYGFELLPAPFVVAHLNVGLALDRLGAPLSGDERAKVYLTNALTGWVESEEPPALPFPEFEEERDAARDVKRAQPILVVLGNPPYNGFAGVSGREEAGLVEPYKHGLVKNWEITKNKLDDLYIRFFRVAERRIAEQTGTGIICYVSNFSWLSTPSAVVMRQELLGKFDHIYIDNLNGDSRETGKQTPEGRPDPSIFSTKLNPAGIQVGTAISLLARQGHRDETVPQVLYRDFWGREKTAELQALLSDPDQVPTDYQELAPAKENWYRLRPWTPRQGYEDWPTIPDLAATSPRLGLNENRGESLISIDREQLLERMKHFLDPEVEFEELDGRVSALTATWARYDPRKVRQKLLDHSPYDPSKAVRFCVNPFDLRWAYIDTKAKLWNEARSDLVGASDLGSEFLVLRRLAPRSLDGAAFMSSRCLIDQHVMHKDAYVVPFFLAAAQDNSQQSETGHLPLFDLEEEVSPSTWRPNLSPKAFDYLDRLGITDADTSQESAQLVWQHVLAVGYTPLYLEENGDAIRSNWPRIPLPSTLVQLLGSARLGRRISDLLDLPTQILDAASMIERGARRMIAKLVRIDETPIAPQSGDFALTAGWAVEQQRPQKSGAISSIVMPGRGRILERERTPGELEGLTEEQRELLGAKVIDVYLNDHVCWSGVPEAVWDFKVGGFQVLRKWLSYRDKKILGRDLRIDEIRQFTDICLRLTELVLLGPQLDQNYLKAVDSSINWSTEQRTGD
jgi:hypothetical protein